MCLGGNKGASSPLIGKQSYFLTLYCLSISSVVLSNALPPFLSLPPSLPPFSLPPCSTLMSSNDTTVTSTLNLSYPFNFLFPSYCSPHSSLLSITVLHSLAYIRLCICLFCYQSSQLHMILFLHIDLIMHVLQSSYMS